MLNWKWFAGAAILALVAILYFVFRAPQDLELQSVRVLQWGELPKQDGLKTGSGPHDLYAEIRFQTSTDLAQFGYGRFYRGLYARSYLCNSGAPISGWLWLVFDNRGPLNPTGSASHGEYHFYISLKSSYEYFHDSNTPMYDLLRTPEPVCFHLVPYFPLVGSWPGFWPSTNVVTVPKESLERAIGQRGN
jgi:hypothetical protein